jgi:hypothetical protein
MSSIRIFRISEGVREIAYTPGMSVAAAITESGLSSPGANDEVRVNNVKVTDLEGTELPENASITIVQKVKGNAALA